MNAPDLSPEDSGKKRKDTMLRRSWRAVRRPIAQSRVVKRALASIIYGFMELVMRTNKRVAGSSDLEAILKREAPGIITFWHGQHLLGASICPRGWPVTAMVSRSADAEMNALVMEKYDFQIARGSGGRGNANDRDKGGARALITLNRALDAGRNVAMIADISKGSVREAGLGIVTLAKLSGRPIWPVAIATSRRKVIEKTWDKTTLHLPFGRLGVIVGPSIRVDSDAGDVELANKQTELTIALNKATEEAYSLVDAKQ
ncbi:lysophospholipid acyltransferase family protein [Limoniibacter endophyticus]|uniref:DUF374 domain-containing protein n=1 Tax=Limoniibacter endophyticus TaxID=1565040 RepID=A0A8J3GGV6_9HYPH|nr:lysophospholipid acyltransferase family protein [Limoniibacter endophyticus]GHC67922.1 hypothetical protein GCM10010136_12470 [Limoniibacter endophyticus]